ncbi:FadR/GntR family transcriptional regulator [Streptomyces sp. NPDC058401]|uniref:FadR/GntR family transcriptional regulator n=1 Tax=Streptomyces sp. NPDC058401 TaxID=3346480 RepID=UPI0036593993
MSTLLRRTIERMRDAIESGEWPLGGKIPIEPDLAEVLGVGRNTVREAVHARCHTGLLDVRQGDGTYVRATSELTAALEHRLDGAATTHLLQLREALDAVAAHGNPLVSDLYASVTAAIQARARDRLERGSPE